APTGSYVGWPESRPCGFRYGPQLVWCEFRRFCSDTACLRARHGVRLRASETGWRLDRQGIPRQRFLADRGNVQAAFSAGRRTQAQGFAGQVLGDFPCGSGLEELTCKSFKVFVNNVISFG